MAKAVYFKGQVTTNEKQHKKHYTQMTEAELNYLIGKVKQIPRTHLARGHAADKFELYDIPKNYVNTVLRSLTKDNIVEYNTGRWEKERRVTLHCNDVIECEDGELVNATFVIDLDTYEVVTIWVNSIYDKHENVNMTYYDENLKIL